jgi:hypothetical protein
VVRADRLARRKLVQARASPLRSDLRAEAQHPRPEAVRITRVIGKRRIGDVDAARTTILTAKPDRNEPRESLVITLIEWPPDKWRYRY